MSTKDSIKEMISGKTKKIVEESCEDWCLLMFAMKMKDYDLVGDLQLFILDLCWTRHCIPPWPGVSGRIADHQNDSPIIEGANPPTRRNCTAKLAKSDDSGNSALRGRRLINQQLELVFSSMPAKDVSLN